MKKLDSAGFARIAAAAAATAAASGRITGWKPDPAAELDRREADREWKKIANNAYGERFMCALGLISALIANGYAVGFHQLAEKEGDAPFDATGWTVISVGGWGFFHISPEDLVPGELEDLVEVLPKGASLPVVWEDFPDGKFSRMKREELEVLVRGSMEPGLDLVNLLKEALTD